MKKNLTVFLIVGLLAGLMLSPITGSAQTLVKTKEYYDIDFDQKNDSGTNAVNKANPDLTFNYAGWASAQDFAKEVVINHLKGNKAEKIIVPAGNGYQYYLGQNVSISETFDNCITWYEISFLYEGGIVPFNLEGAGCAFTVNSEGKIYIGGNVGHTASNCKFEVGEWYHLVVAADNVNKWAGTDTMFYAWINGVFLETPETPMTKCTVSRGSAAFSTMTRFLFNVHQNPGANVNLWIDDVKMYTTYGPIRDNLDNFNYNPNEIFSGAELSSTHYKIENDKIYVPAADTLGDLSEAITSSKNSVSFFEGDTAIAEEDWALTSAAGKSIYSHSTSGIGIKKYTVETGNLLFDVKRESIRWQKDNGEPEATKTNISELSYLEAGDNLYLDFDFINDTSANPKTCILVVAMYNNGILSDYKFVDVHIDTTTPSPHVSTGAMKVESVENLSIKSYVWTAPDNFTPIATCFELK